MKFKKQKNVDDSWPQALARLGLINISFWLLFFKKEVPALLLLAACAPSLPQPDTAVTVNAYLPGGSLAPLPEPAAWWRIFGSARLDDLVAHGLAANPTIGEAAQNLLAAQLNAKAASGAFLPQLGLGSTNNDLVSRQSYPSGPNGYPPYTLYAPSGMISYDPGLFGARKYTAQNGRALAQYQAAELEVARQNVAANIVAATLGRAGAAGQIATTQRIIAAEQKLLTLLQGEYADGAIPQLNVLQQQSQILATEATLPPLQTLADTDADRLAILTGTLPADFTAPDIALDDLALPQAIPAALPSVYLASRPDIIAARATVAAQNAALGLAVAHLYPDISLTAQGGYASETLNTLFEPEAAFWTLAGNLLAPLYEGGTLHARKQAAQAELAAALFAYQQTVLAAFGQAADALQAIGNDQTALTRAEAAARTANAAFQLAGQQFQLGAVDYTTVLTAQGSAAQAALTQAQARANLLLDIANLQAIMAP